MSGTLCTDVERFAADLVAGDGSSAAQEELLRHAASCARCSRVLVRERSLQACLRALPPGAGPGAAPSLPSRRPGRLLGLPWAAAAAAALVAGIAAGAFVASRGPVPTSEVGTETAYRFIDADPHAGGWDERLLALASGAETVAARRPAEGR